MPQEKLRGNVDNGRGVYADREGFQLIACTVVHAQGKSITFVDTVVQKAEIEERRIFARGLSKSVFLDPARPRWALNSEEVKCAVHCGRYE